jgi:hypothetical protein
MGAPNVGRLSLNTMLTGSEHRSGAAPSARSASGPARDRDRHRTQTRMAGTRDFITPVA